MKHTNHVIASERLGKEVAVRVYGTKGYPMIAFPTQDQMANEWEDNGMLDVFEPYLEAGRVQLFTVDSNDLESWSSTSDDFAARIARQEDYYDFVCEELLPYVHQTNGSMYRPELTGASLGATQATICALRRPDLFQGVIALSGMYHTSYFFGDWGNDVSYANDVNAFLPNTPADHPYLELYRHRTFAFSIGQAADEQFGVSDLHFLQDTFQRLGIDGWFDFWGPECNHDWYWWKQQMGKFLPEAVKELEGVAQAEPELAKAPAAPVEAKKATKASQTAPAMAEKESGEKPAATAKAPTSEKAAPAKAKASTKAAAKKPAEEAKKKTVSGMPAAHKATKETKATAKRVTGTKAESAKKVSAPASAATAASKDTKAVKKTPEVTKKVQSSTKGTQTPKATASKAGAPKDAETKTTVHATMVTKTAATKAKASGSAKSTGKAVAGKAGTSTRKAATRTTTRKPSTRGASSSTTAKRSAR